MMHEREKSGLAVVAMKPTNKAERSAAELGSQGRGRGECGPAQHGPGTEPGNRVTGVGMHTASFAAKHPRWEPYAGKPLVLLCAGRAQK